MQPHPIKGKIFEEHPLFDLIDDAFRVFSYPKPKSTEVCTRCCMDPHIEAHFFDPPIKELPLEYVQDWYFAAADPKGIAKETWAYLLPRILEILASGEDVSNVALEVSLSRFQTGDADNWTAKQWRVLDEFQRRYLGCWIDTDAGFLDDAICMFRLGAWNLEELITQVSAASDTRLAERLWRDWCKVVPGRESIWVTSFWEGSDNQRIFDFYTSPALKDRLAGLALAADTEEHLAAKAMAVASLIESNSQW